MTDLLIKFELAFGKRRKFEIVIMMDYEFDDAYTNCFWFNKHPTFIYYEIMNRFRFAKAR